MCQQLRPLRQSITDYAGRFDAKSLTPAQAGEVVRLCAQIEASISSIKARAAARSAEGRDWKAQGYRSEADRLARETGMSPASARRALQKGRRLEEQPEVAKAAAEGELSPEQAEAVAEGVEADPSKAKELIEAARRGSLAELNNEVTRIKNDHRDQEQARAGRHARRSLRAWTDRDGAFQAHLYGHPEDGARLWRMLDPIRRRLNMLRREAGQADDPLDALDYDALVTMAGIAGGVEGELSLADLVDLGLFPQLRRSDPNRPPAQGSEPPLAAAQPVLFDGDGPDGPNPDSPPPPVPPEPSDPKPGRAKKLAGSPLRVMVRVDLDALLRGVAVEGELCDMPGYGPVPVSVVEDLLATENPFIVGILTKGQELIGVYHHGRHPNAYQRSALDFLSPMCTVEGCSSRAGLQYDHREDFQATGITAFDLLDRLCRHHHGQKTHHGWALVPGRGKRAFVAPGDPRHPRHAHTQTEAAPP